MFTLQCVQLANSSPRRMCSSMLRVLSACVRSADTTTQHALGEQKLGNSKRTQAPHPRTGQLPVPGCALSTKYSTFTQKPACDLSSLLCLGCECCSELPSGRARLPPTLQNSADRSAIGLHLVHRRQVRTKLVVKTNRMGEMCRSVRTRSFSAEARR